MEKTSIPTALRIVAVLQLLGGLLAVADVLIQWTQRHHDFNLGVLGIPISFGLMRLCNGWRLLALLFLGVGVLLTPIAFVLGIMADDPVDLALLGVRVVEVSPLWLSLASAVMFGICYWQYRVLGDPRIRALFAPSTISKWLDADLRAVGRSPASRSG